MDVHSDLALKMTADLFWTGLLVSLPIMGITMAVGLVISILQVVTQVQEMSLTFVPKIVAAVAVLLVVGPWMLKYLMGVATRLISSIPSLV